MMELRFGLALGVFGALATAVGCGGSEATGDGDDDTPRAGASNAGASAGGSGSSMNGPGATAGRAGSTGTGGASAGTGGAGAGTGGASAGTAGTGTGECVDTEAPLCLNSVDLRVCSEGAYETLVCAELCSGFDAGSCDTSENLCSCGNPQRPDCAGGAAAFCYCRESEAMEACSDDELLGFYLACFEKDAEAEPILTCLNNHIVEEANGSTIDCAMAATDCFPETPPAP